jgi:hypothetical protein
MNRTIFSKVKTILLLYGIGLLLSLPAIAQTRVVVTKTDGQEYEYLVAEDGRIFFDEENLLLDEGYGNTASFPRSQIQKLTVASAEGTDIAEAAAENAWAVYPNPAAGFIRITTAAAGKVPLTLCSLHGRILLSGEYAAGEEIDVSFLPKGFYLIKINNRTIKFIKS